jgi:hypothetical protein
MSKAREYNLKRHYGITLEQYNEMLEKQDHRCAVCEKHRDDMKINLAVDHDHKTGEIFGLLCSYCNRYLIGRQRDWRKYDNAAKFLKEGTGMFVPKDAPKKKRRTKRKRERKTK